MPISTRNLTKLPDISTIEKITQSLAMLDAILCPEWEYRYFSFNAIWDSVRGERMASLRNGSGDEYFLLFTSHGAIMKGFDHESTMRPSSNESRVWPGVLDSVPLEFTDFLNEPAFNMTDTTFCLWRTSAEEEWHRGNEISFPEGEDPDGSARLLWALDGDPLSYKEFASNYFEVDVDLAAVRDIFRHIPLSRDLVRRLNAERIYDDLEGDATEIAYPKT